MNKQYVISESEYEKLIKATENLKNITREIFQRIHCFYKDEKIYNECSNLLGRLSEIRKVLGLGEVNL